MTWYLIKQALFPSGEGSPTITLLYWLVLVLLAGLEFFSPQFHDLQRGQRWPVNFGLGLINLSLIPLVPISALWASEWAHHNGVGVLYLLNGSWWFLDVIATIAILSFASYTTHWIFHKTPWFWRVHRVHHFDTGVDVSTGLRHHPLELLLPLAIDVPTAIAFGLLPWAVITYGTAEAMLALFSHANIRLPPSLDRMLRLVLVTPRIHAVHHSAYQPETDSNYGTVFTVWDRLFGTYCDLRADCPEEMQFGSTELQDKRASDLWWQLKSPLCPVTKLMPTLSTRSKSSLP
jgi:sterol desaturase/sphingolipid hydroxylase (fatty acid hydroxylase superfamily)